MPAKFSNKKKVKAAHDKIKEDFSALIAAGEVRTPVAARRLHIDITVAKKGEEIKKVKAAHGKKDRPPNADAIKAAVHVRGRSTIRLNAGYYAVVKKDAADTVQVFKKAGSDDLAEASEGLTSILDIKTAPTKVHLGVGMDHNLFKVPNVRGNGFPGNPDLMTKIEQAAADEHQKAKDAQGGGDPPDALTFFDPKNNAVVRSFHSTRGKGLAGVITNMTLDYSEAPWQTEHNAKGPMLASITMTFSPIHDLPLGLDVNGRMRAPAIPINNPFVDRAPLASDADAKTVAIGKDALEHSAAKTQAANTRNEFRLARLGGKADSDIRDDSGGNPVGDAL